MPTERCWNCNQIKRGVELCPSEDRLCPECYKANEQQLKELLAAPMTMDTATSVTDGDSVSAIHTINAVKNGPDHDDAVFSIAENKKLKQKQARGKKNKNEEATMQLRSTSNSNDRNEQGAEVIAAAAATSGEVAALRQLVLSQQDAIRRLQNRLNFVLSYIGIDDTAVSTDDTTQVDNGGAQMMVEAGAQIEPLADAADLTATVKDTNGQELSWSEVVSKRRLHHHRADTFQQSIVTAVYVDQAIRKQRENSLVVTGLAPTASRPDCELFAELCAAEFHVQPDVVSVKRIGHMQTDRVQPLLVYLKQADQTKLLINSAKLLRHSTNSVVREKVFINPNLTKAEAEAAYQVRVQRRLAQQQRQQQQQQRQRIHSQPSSEQDSRTVDHTLQTGGLAATNGNDMHALNPRATSFTSSAAASLQPRD
jgi:hypothetical protein